MIIKSCDVCKAEFITYPSTGKRFCSKECYYVAKTTHIFDKVCIVCGTSFLGTIKSVYCSDYCCSKQQHENEKKLFSISCPDCGEVRQVKVPRYKLKSVGRCRKCAAKVGVETYPRPSGENNSNWKGGRQINKNGYIRLYCPGHPFASGNYVKEHLYVASEHYGVDFVKSRGGVVHHINGNKHDNRIENLYPCSVGENTSFNSVLLNIAFKLVGVGFIQFSDGEYTCPTLDSRSF